MAEMFQNGESKCQVYAFRAVPQHKELLLLSDGRLIERKIGPFAAWIGCDKQPPLGKVEIKCSNQTIQVTIKQAEQDGAYWSAYGEMK